MLKIYHLQSPSWIFNLKIEGAKPKTPIKVILRKGKNKGYKGFTIG